MTENALPKGYEPADVEARWRAYWTENKTFSADASAPGEPFSIVIPPPNVTGTLHMGHALNLTLQDILCRYKRQKGCKVLWVPGTDHAGIATQNVVERALAKEGKTRDDLGREAFIERVWEWKQEYGDKILNQITYMGASVDWSRLRFTMDEGLSRAVRAVFVRLYNEGLIYKGDYIINWCPRCQTALADLEVEHSPKKGAIYRIRYPLSDGSGYVIVATTRPETLLGDTGVAVHPDDERYLSLHGKSVSLPLTDRVIPIITDAYVDLEFGTGCLKVTPAHDHNDFELGRKHNLPVLSVMDETGTMNEHAGAAYQGMDRWACREKIVEDLKALGLLEGIDEHEHSVGECYRCKTVIEPYVSPQWFVRTGPLAKVAREAVSKGDTSIHPEHWTKTYYEWLDNIRDWCISRQIWWGHRIPAWTCDACGELVVSLEDPTSCPKCGGALTRDPDVLDTWFSSALWPFTTMGWPDDTKELKVFYPTSVLVTGFDILFFWVARMMMMGLHFMEEVPFKDVYIHALVRDGEGRKMSKSLGNVIDPLIMIERFGTDALRFTLCAFAAMGRDIKLSEDRIEGYRHFINKIWNACRFALMNLPEDVPALPDPTTLSLPNRWILHRLEEVKVQIEDVLGRYQFNEAAQVLYGFFWRELCDWYLEMIKGELSSEDEARKGAAQAVLTLVLSETLTLLHPIIPFVTQEIFSVLPGLTERDLSKVPYPVRRENCDSLEAAAAVKLIQDVIVAVRNIRAELSIAPGHKLSVSVKTSGPVPTAVLTENAAMIMSLARLGSLTASPDVVAPKASASAAVETEAVFVELSGAVDFDGELARLAKEAAKASKEAETVDRKLANEDFVARAPADVVAKEREKADALRQRLDKLNELTKRIEAMRDSTGE